jgi:lantibiotic modifying enzyme
MNRLSEKTSLADEFLMASIAIGAKICADAKWDSARKGCNWVAPTLPPSRESGVQSLSPDIYTGAGGIAWYLTQLAIVTQERAFGVVAKAALHAALLRLSDKCNSRSELSVFGGPLGVAIVAIRAGRALDDTALVSAGDELIRKAATSTSEANAADIIDGYAGAVLALLALAHDHGSDQYRILAAAFGIRLLGCLSKNRYPYRNELDMRIEGSASGNQHLCGFAHGLAGMSAALFALYSTTNDQHFLNCARHLVNEEDGMFVPGAENWIDRRYPFDAWGVPQFTTAWCHGAPGIAISRVVASRSDVQFANTYTETAKRALTRTTDECMSLMKSGRSASCLCHGLAGLTDIALLGGMVLGDSNLLEKAYSSGQHMLAMRESNGHLPAEKPHPSLLLGLAGMGYLFLRLSRPNRTPSVLSLGFV